MLVSYVALCLFPMLPYACFLLLRWVRFCSFCLRQVFSGLGDKKVVAGSVRQAVVIYSGGSKYFMGICLNRFDSLSIYVCVYIYILTIIPDDTIQLIKQARKYLLFTEGNIWMKKVKIPYLM